MMSMDDDFNQRFLRAATGLGIVKSAEDAEPTETSDDVVVSGVLATPTADQAVADATLEARTISTSNYLSHPDTHPIVLDLVLLQKYGPEWFEWEPEVVELRVEYDMKQQLSDLNNHKLQAVKTLHMVDTYWQEWHVFCWVTMALNGIPPDFRVMQVPTVAQSMVSVDIANRIRQDVPFSSELNDYLEQVHMYDGIFCPQEPLTFVTMDDVEGYVVDCAEVQRLWPAVRGLNKAPTDESVTSEQLRRMLDVHRHLEWSRSLLRNQLQLVVHA